MINRWIRWFFMEEQQVLGHSRRHTKFQKQKDPSPANCLITLTNCRLQSFPRMTRFTVNVAAVTLLKQNKKSLLLYWKKNWPQNKPMSKLSYQSHHLQELRTINVCKKHGSTSKWLYSKTVCAGITIKILFPAWRLWKNDRLLPQQSYQYEADKDLLKKSREVVFGGQSIVFTRKAVVEETFIRKSQNMCKSSVGLDASQLNPYSMFQPMPTCIYTQWDLDPQANRFTLRQNKTRGFENLVMSFFQRTTPDCKIESFFTTFKRDKTDCFSVDGFCFPCNAKFEAIGCFYHFCPSQEVRSSLTQDDIQRGSKKRELDKLRRNCIRGNNFTVF